MSGRSNAETAARRWRSVWRKTERGMAQRAIARELGIDEKSVRYYLAKGRPAELTRNTSAEPAARSSAPLSRIGPAGSNVVPLRRQA